MTSTSICNRATSTQGCDKRRKACLQFVHVALMKINLMWKVTHGITALMRREAYRITDVCTHIHLQLPLFACRLHFIAGGTLTRPLCTCTKKPAGQVLEFDWPRIWVDNRIMILSKAANDNLVMSSLGKRGLMWHNYGLLTMTGACKYIRV